MKELLQILLPKILPYGLEEPLIIPHNGKSDLAKSIPIKLRGWQNPDDKFVIVHDQDSHNCMDLKARLLHLCENSKNEVMVRIACRELEAWYFGDLKAVSLAYNKDYTHLSAKRKFREPDKLENAKEAFKHLVPAHQQLLGASLIAPHMDISRNTSYSFNVFVNGVKKMCCAHAVERI